MAMAFWRDGSQRVAISFIGEGGSSLGEWHEAINLCAARRLPAIFCVREQPDRVVDAGADQSAVRVFADKAAGYGVPGITVDGTDPDADRRRVHLGGRARPRRATARRSSRRCRCACAATRTTTTCCISARTRRRPGTIRRWPSTATPTASSTPTGPRAIRSRCTPRGCRTTGIIAPGDLDRFKREAEAIVEEQARAVIDAPWPEPASAGVGVFANEPPRVHMEVLDPASG